ncbi:ABC transporter substrate-binding protein [Marivibrio halodurans]|uniref:ABC transporter substrate-binding protein n=1 Tax=Marivibrio halodurans TaxID=2039722 RepID=A0A8J7S3V3_9PROT|nr:ABC transporter substrate-binding protein [Marivibrio halodurans]MBP5856239.1 ABC transporter substrate-binding protein [Marivibrio halodurans]
MRMMGIAALALAFMISAGTARADAPRRVVSMNLCTDQLVLMLADRERIASVSYLAARPEDSLMAGATNGLVLNHGQIEEVLPLKPELAIAGLYTTRFTAAILRDLGIPVLDLPPARTFDDVRANIRKVAEALGVPARGEDMITAMNARIDRLRGRVARAARPRALIYRAGGYTLGRQTFAGELLALAGYENAAADYGITEWGAVPVEAVLQLKPDALIVGIYRDNAPSLARDVTKHPALAVHAPRVIEVQTRHWSCGTPAALDIVARLIAARGQS